MKSNTTETARGDGRRFQSPVSETRIYERDTDALFIRMLRQNIGLANVLAAQFGLASCEVIDVKPQQRHVADTGSIDIVARLRSGLVLLVENKIDAGYSITRAGHGQPQRYQRSVAAYRSAGAVAHSVLLAPQCYLLAGRQKEAFDLRISYEQVCAEAHGTDRELLIQAIAQANAPYEPLPNEGAGEFFAAARAIIRARYPDLVMKRDPNEAGVRPEDSRTIYFDVAKTLRVHAGAPRPRMSIQCWDKAAPSASAKIMLGNCAHLSERVPKPSDLTDIGGYFRPAGRSLGIVIDTPRLDTQRSIVDQTDEFSEALNAALSLQRWWNDNGPFINSLAGRAGLRGPG